MTRREAVRLRAKVRAMRSGVVQALGFITLGDLPRAKEALAETYDRSWSPDPDPGIRVYSQEGAEELQRTRDSQAERYRGIIERVTRSPRREPPSR